MNKLFNVIWVILIRIELTFKNIKDIYFKRKVYIIFNISNNFLVTVFFLCS